MGAKRAKATASDTGLYRRAEALRADDRLSGALRESLPRSPDADHPRAAEELLRARGIEIPEGLTVRFVSSTRRTPLGASTAFLLSAAAVLAGTGPGPWP